MPPLGGRRPSELLMEMLQLCSRDDKEGKIIWYMFLFCLPPTMQSMLGEDDTSSIANLAARADALMDAKVAKDHPVAAAVEESMVAPAGVPPPPARGSRTRPRRSPQPRRNTATGTGVTIPDPGRTWACAGPTTTGAERPETASRPAPGRETNCPGAAQPSPSLVFWLPWPRVAQGVEGGEDLAAVGGQYDWPWVLSRDIT